MVKQQIKKPPRYEIPQKTAIASPLPIAVGIIAACLLAFTIWYFLIKQAGPGSDEPIPLITAESGEIKTRPDNSAQPEVPHQDKQIYSRVNPAEKQAKVENLLSENEDPIDLAELEVEEEVIESVSIPTGYNDFKKEEYEPKIVEPKISHDNFPSPTQIKEEKPLESKSEEIKVVETVEKIQTDKPTSVEKIENTTTTEAIEQKSEPVRSRKLKSGYRVQLASMKSPESAKKEWNRLKGDFKGVLGNLNPHYARVDLGSSKGIFYRVQVGDFSDKESAQQVCNNLKRQNGKTACFVVPF